MTYSGMNKNPIFGNIKMPNGYQGGSGIGDGMIERQQMEQGILPPMMADPALTKKKSMIDRIMANPEALRNMGMKMGQDAQSDPAMAAPAAMQLNQPNPQAMPQPMMGVQTNGDFMRRLQQLMAPRGLSGMPNQRR